MANVKGPFFSTFASGSILKTLTVNAHFKNNTFVMQMHKQRSGKRHPIQIENAQIFKERMVTASIIKREAME